MKKQEKIHSFVFNVPLCNKFGKLPLLNNPDKIKNLKSLPKNLKESTDHGSPFDEISSEKLTPRSEISTQSTPIKFLPYIYAQNGLKGVRAMLSPEKFNKNIDILPLARKESTYDIINVESNSTSIKTYSRVRSLELLRKF